MKIINNIEIDNPNQWIERFVEQVLENAGIDCEQALIEEIEEEAHSFECRWSEIRYQNSGFSSGCS